MTRYAKYYDYITTRGVMVPDTSVVLSEIQNQMKELFGSDLNVSPETPQGRIIEMLQRSRTFTIETVAAISNMFNLGKATGFVLDDLGSLFLNNRQPATRTTVAVIMTGVPGTVIPAGTRLQNTAGDIFINPAQYILGSATPCPYTAEKTGVIACPAGSLTIILDSVNGLETVNNPSDGIIGTEQESDNVFRQRIKDGRDINSIAILSSVKSNLEAIPGVVGTYCEENTGGTEVVVDDIHLPGHSLLAVVDGGDEDAIAEVLYSKKSLGCGYCTTSDNSNIKIKEVNVIDPSYGTVYTVKFARPETTDIDISIKIKKQNYTGSDLENAVKNAIIEWSKGNNPEVDGLKLGGDVSPFEISAAVSSEIPQIFVNECTIAKHGQPLSAATLSLDKAEKGQILSSNITVVLL